MLPDPKLTTQNHFIENEHCESWSNLKQTINTTKTELITIQLITTEKK